MFDSTKYHREYMREYRKKPLTDDQKKKRNAAAKRYRDREKERADPERLATRKLYHLEYQRKRRLEPAFRKEAYRKHTVWTRKNKEHLNSKQRKRNKRPEVALQRKTKLLKKKYGLTHEEYTAKIAANDGKCPICADALAVKPCVDHNHATGQVRDVLCNRCNQWIGFVETRRDLVAPMLSYLDKWDAIEGVIK